MQLMLSEFWRSDFIVYIAVFVDMQLRILKKVRLMAGTEW